jgi:hypothetical protein
MRTRGGCAPTPLVFAVAAAVSAAIFLNPMQATRLPPRQLHHKEKAPGGFSPPRASSFTNRSAGNCGLYSVLMGNPED